MASSSSSSSNSLFLPTDRVKKDPSFCLLSAQMGTVSRNRFSDPVLLLLFFFISLSVHISMAANTISAGQSLSGNQTMVSKEGNFELGFFSPGTSHNYYIGIWYKKIPKRTVIWVANREMPISNPSSSELKISENGSSLVLLNHFKVPIWSSSIATPSASNSTIAVLLDTGNLVLGVLPNPSSALIWQSFDHLTDTWMPNGWVGFNKITGEYQYLSSWRSKEDPAPGPFSYRIDEGGSSEFFLRWNGSERYWGTGVWTGEFTLIPELRASHKFNFSYEEDDRRRYYTYSIYDNSTTARATLDVTGRIKLWVWFDSPREWQEIWARPISQCDVYSPCGAFGVCDMKGCECLDGFEPTNTRDWELDDRSAGCSRKIHLQCSNSSSNLRGRNDWFQMLQNMQLPINSQSLAVKNAELCESACLNSCQCTAYAYGRGCVIWNGGLRNLRQLHDGDSEARNLSLRIAAASELRSSSGSCKTVYMVIFVAFVGALIIVGIILMLAWRYQSRRTGSPEAIEGGLVPFAYTNLQRVTKNFSEKLGGGGFGSVYKGTMPDSTVVAVKKLEGLGQGEKQFRTEVRTLGTIQHVNLVRLRGFCAEGTKMLLVYDYMPNGSLDAHLFSNSRGILDWRTRYQIILGIARGLAYLHEKCRECIIHCDVKPENILLDEEFRPKVADFGLAKLVGRDFSQVLTTMRGTIGYLAPEWISGVAITPKADVYSFGMVLFEVVSGRRNTEKCEDGKIGYFPLWAAFKVNEGEVLDLLDEKLGHVSDPEELTRAFRVACWCIQDCEDHRPSMGQIVQILEGALEVKMPPIPRSLQHLIEDDGNSFCHSEFSKLKASF